ncbi:O-methyltransferase, family 2 [Penicillium occitanis (nom. inval.)]|nr:O-methyltransferase, family 2 [Penicillium occitanis (nom. inval.)]PCH00625.1 hypothetical protein PENOC_052120 [Penicillium occitanis (nom. inval.)]
MDINTDLESIAASIVENTKAIGEYRLKDSSGNIQLLPRDAPQEAQHARQLLLQASIQLQQLCTEPSEFLDQAQIHYQQLSAFQWLIHFQILQHIPLGTDVSVAYEDIAKAANVSSRRLKSVARMAMTGGILAEDESQRVKHSRISAQIVSEPALLDWALFITRYSAPTALAFARATERWGDSKDKNETAYNLAFNTPMAFFDHVSQSEEMTQHFAGYMRGQGRSSGLAVEHLITGYDWARLGPAHVVDVGGSTGQIALMLASNFPDLSFTIEDLPSTIEESRIQLRDIDPSIASRISLKAHDFMQPQPPEISHLADVYLLRKILHDWPTATAHKILQNLVSSMKPGARIVVMDTILPLPGTFPTPQEAALRVRDLIMAQNFNSNERERDDWIELFGSTTPPLRLNNEWQSMKSVMAVMELVIQE